MKLTQHRQMVYESTISVCKLETGARYSGELC